MNLQKKLEKLGIEHTIKLDNESIRVIATNVTEALTRTFPIIYDEYNNILIKLLNCNMYVSKVTTSISRVNYIYENNSIYFDEEMNLTKIDEQMIHECIHYLQDNRNSKGKLNKIGLCNFDDFKVYGLGINEAAVQYISAKVMQNMPTSTEKYGVRIKTISPYYYPFLTNLIEQFVHLMGEDALIKGTLNGSNEFEDLLYETFEGHTKKIINKFDEVMEFNNYLNLEEDNNNIKILQEKIASIYIDTQKYIFSTYFNKMCPRLNTIQEVDFYTDKAIYYKNIMGIEIDKRFQTNEFYETYMQELEKKLSQKLIQINKQKSRNALFVVNKNIFTKLIQKIVSYFAT